MLWCGGARSTAPLNFGDRWKDEKAQAALGASLFEVGGEFAAAVDLQGADGKGMRCWRVSRN